MNASPNPDDLDVLSPAPVKVQLSDGLVLNVYPITVRQLAPLVRALGTARDALAAADVDVWDLIASHGEAVSAGLSVALGINPDAIERMKPAEYLACINSMLEANRDFLGAWLLRPMMAQAARQMQTAGVGQISSHPSSPPDTILTE